MRPSRMAIVDRFVRPETIEDPAGDRGDDLSRLIAPMIVAIAAVVLDVLTLALVLLVGGITRP